VIGELVVFVAVKLGVLPVPEAANPILASEFVQVKVPPTGLLTYELAGTLSQSQ
jgi:hypothetical protein